MDKIMSGKYNDAQISGFLIALRAKGENYEEIAGFAQAMREKMTPINIQSDAMDMCGTGGDAKGTFNISTAASFVIAGAGGTVAKHVQNGDNVCLVVVCEGSSYRGVSQGDNERHHSLLAAKVLGVRDVRMLDFPDQKLDTYTLTDIITPIEIDSAIGIEKKSSSLNISFAELEEL